MKKHILLVLLFLIKLNSCFGQGNNGVENKNKVQDYQNLIIEGDRIWVREQPKIGKVVCTLNTGEVCRILEKGEEQIIRGNKDFWYKIEHEDKIGWVFGSQTSIKQHANFEPFLDDFLQASFFGKKFDSLTYFKSESIRSVTHKEIELKRLYNPGAACIFYDSYEGDIKHNSVYPKIEKSNRYFNQEIEEGFCEESANENGVYYKIIEKLPESINMESGEGYIGINIPDKYKNGHKVKVDILVDKWIEKTMYFMVADKKWWLVLIDDCDCSA